jgi:hypothetical protein
MKTKWRRKYNDPEYCARLRANEKDDCVYYLECLGEIAKQKYEGTVPCKDCDRYVKQERSRLS